MFVIVNQNMFDLRTIFCIVMASQIQTMELTVQIQQLDAPLFSILNTLMVHAYQAVLTQEEMSGTMEPTSAILLAPEDIMIS